MYKIFVQDSEYFVGKKGMEFLVRVFKDHCRVEEIELTENKGSANLIGDENSFNSTHRKGRP